MKETAKLGPSTIKGVDDLGTCLANLYVSFIECFVGCMHVSKSMRRTVVRRGLIADFFIGDEAMNATGYSVKYPVRHGIVEDWDLMV